MLMNWWRKCCILICPWLAVVVRACKSCWSCHNKQFICHFIAEQPFQPWLTQNHCQRSGLGTAILPIPFQLISISYAGKNVWIVRSPNMVVQRDLWCIAWMVVWPSYLAGHLPIQFIAVFGVFKGYRFISSTNYTSIY